jgi:hypothetical protein
MTRIRIVPDQLRLVSTHLRQVATDLRTLEARISGVYGRLEWEAQHRALLEGSVNQGRQQALALAGQADELARSLLARSLTAKAQDFDEADAWGASLLLDVATAWSSWQAAYRPVTTDEAEPVDTGPAPETLRADIADAPSVDGDDSGGKLKSLEETPPSTAAPRP